ncbi:Ribonuclease VapC26 [Halomicronema hongdechloris C2206]|uniref:Ribonuclease VapC26 n=1 Tax=Halomicronema hongdechloris C2206 TaxID=1641165 RepID=A0A1Z3HV67_9CYAN|nr:PIN domain-containing protein [Halomicronema hongdechloris]ASC74162.1 Ribonuclease VapC26 [Halomicronema hongdechloris C2206]
MEAVLADSGFVVALVNKADPRHVEVRAVYLQFPQILLPQVVLVEVAYLVGRDVGIPTVVAFLKGIPASRFVLTASTDPDIARAANIVEQYLDSKVDFVDSTIMAMAERLAITTILTIDQRDFRIFRPSHCESFRLLP